MTQYQNPVPPYETPGVAQKASGLAIAALVCGIVGFIVPGLGLVGLILGIVALMQRKSPTEPGKGLAIGGVVTGGLSLLCVPALLISILLPSLNRAREAANRVKCASNLRQIGLGIKLYANEDPGMHLPPNLALVMKTQDLSGEAFCCPVTAHTPPTAPEQVVPGSNSLSYVYAYKPGWTDNLPYDVVLAYEPIANHNGDGANFLYADGHVDWVSGKQAQSYITQIESGVNPPK